jgi:hypothetical protein
VLLSIGCLAAAGQEAPAKLTLEISRNRFKAEEKVTFRIQLANISAKPFYVRRRIDVYSSDPLIGQYVLEVKQKGNHPFRDVFTGFNDYGRATGAGPHVATTDEQFAARNEIVLLQHGAFIGRSFEDVWKNIIRAPSEALPQQFQGPGKYILRVRYIPWRDSFGNPSMILDTSSPMS